MLFNSFYCSSAYFFDLFQTIATVWNAFCVQCIKYAIFHKYISFGTSSHLHPQPLATFTYAHKQLDKQIKIRAEEHRKVDFFFFDKNQRTALKQLYDKILTTLTKVTFCMFPTVQWMERMYDMQREQERISWNLLSVIFISCMPYYFEYYA